MSSQRHARAQGLVRVSVFFLFCLLDHSDYIIWSICKLHFTIYHLLYTYRDWNEQQPQKKDADGNATARRYVFLPNPFTCHFPTYLSICLDSAVMLTNQTLLHEVCLFLKVPGLPHLHVVFLSDFCDQVPLLTPPHLCRIRRTTLQTHFFPSYPDGQFPPSTSPSRLSQYSLRT